MGTDGSGSRRIPNSEKISSKGQAPPPIPEAAKRQSASPPPLPGPVSRPPELPGQLGEEDESTNPRIFRDQQGMLETLISFYPDEKRLLQKNGNAKPVLQRHLKRLKDELLMQLEGTTKFFFRLPIRYAVIGATILGLAAGSMSIHSCTELGKLQRSMQETEKEHRELKQQIKKLETQLKELKQEKKQKPKKTSFLPRCLKSPQQKPIQKTIPKTRPTRRVAYS